PRAGLLHEGRHRGGPRGGREDGGRRGQEERGEGLAMHLDVVTPRGRLLTEEVEEVTAPGILGEFGVLPGHIPFLTALKPGVLRYRAASSSGILAVGAGFVEVSAGD